MFLIRSQPGRGAAGSMRGTGGEEGLTLGAVSALGRTREGVPL